MSSITTHFTNLSVRVAEPSDIKRMGSVTIAGCHPSQSFSWQQPHYANNRRDALRASRQTYKEHMMKDMDKVLLVIEDEYNPSEGDFCPEVLTTDDDDDEQSPLPGQKVVVGVAVYTLPKSSNLLGSFQNTRAMEISLPAAISTAHADFWHCMTYWKKQATVIGTHFPYDLFLSTLTVHPAYSRRGHGEALVRAGFALAKKEKLDMGLVASEYGIRLYERMGFEFVEDFVIKGDEISPRGLVNEVMRWRR